MRLTSPFLPSVALLLIGSHALVAQSLQTGAITGVVKDAEDKPMAGIQIQAKSGQTQRTAVTNAKGEYRLSLMNPGVWILTVGSKDHQVYTVRATVGINETHTAHFRLRPLAEATVVVADKADTLNITTPQIATSFNRETIAKIPSDMTSLDEIGRAHV